MVRKALEDLDKILDGLSPKQQSIIESWLKKWGFFLKNEATFLPYRNVKYNEKDIVTVNFGYNVGSEQGGSRPAVVIEDNNQSDKTVMVVPLASINSPDETVHHRNVFLGVIPALNKVTRKPEETESKALVNQMRAISKQRIVAPTRENHNVMQVSDTQLKLIRGKMQEIYC